MFRLHRRNLSPSKRFRLRLLQTVFASVALTDASSACIRIPPIMYVFFACFLTEYVFRHGLFLTKSVQRMQVMSLEHLLSKDFFQVLIY